MDDPLNLCLPVGPLFEKKGEHIFMLAFHSMFAGHNSEGRNLKQNVINIFSISFSYLHLMCKTLTINCSQVGGVIKFECIT